MGKLINKEEYTPSNDNDMTSQHVFDEEINVRIITAFTKMFIIVDVVR